MSNEVINPYQTFRDDRGSALAGGALRIFVNRTTSLGTAFSDSELTIPQEVNPYRLDGSGRVQADLRWSGLRTVQVLDRSNATVRTLNDVVTLVDTSGFAIIYDSVADMTADTSLEEGDIAHTTSYNAGQRQGGARYLITATAEPVDEYLVHTIAGGNGLQARLLDVESNKNFYVAGAIGNGAADDSDSVQRLLDVGGDIECANGSFRAEGLTLSLDARIHGDGTLISTQLSSVDLLTLSGSDLAITFDGITIDGDSANQSAEVAKASIVSAVTATTGNESVISFTNVTFQNGPQFDVDGDAADDGQSVLYSFGTCRFLGGLESSATPYQAASVRITDGPNAQFEDCLFDLTAAATADGGRGAILAANAAFTNPAFLSVNACVFNRMGADADGGANALGAINATGLGQLTIADCQFLTPTRAAIAFGAELASVVIAGNSIDNGDQLVAAILAVATTQTNGGGNWQIDNNQLTSIPGVGIQLDGAGASTTAFDVTVSGNLIDAPTSQAMLPENIENLALQDNFINMASVAATNAIEIDADGLSGVFKVEGNTIVNVAGVAIEADVTNGADFLMQCAGNVLENITGTGIFIDNGAANGAAIVQNNAMSEITATLIDVGNLATCVIGGNTYIGTDPATWITEATAITALVVRDNFVAQIEDSIKLIASAAAIEITSAYHEINGTTAITSATFPADVIGFVSVWRGVDATGPLVTDGMNLNLNGNFTLGQDDTLALIWDGTNWNEVSRSVN